ncbi:uncharacterized protein BDV17DRAFT_300323 [Aspergillus undulatus]|uniref:uncharacterized protein n=1 Tax=Aspergillus undulatus TaxID=1810928 RepID=UPI003CCC97F9
MTAKLYVATAFPGRYLAIDMGGTNLRICDVALTKQKGAYTIEQDKYRLPPHLRKEKLEDFLTKYKLVGKNGEKLPLAFTFSYPVTQDHIRHGVLQRWTKGFDISGVEGEDVVAHLEEDFERRNASVRLVALVNDTVGTLIASAYKNPATKIGSIFATGCNAAYMEKVSRIPKIANHGSEFESDALVFINCEYGAFDNRHKVLPRTRFDEEIDETSARPGQQAYEKMVAGMYMGELLRLLLLHLHESSGFFTDAEIDRLRGYGTMDSASLSRMEVGGSEAGRMTAAKCILKELYGIEATDEEARVCCLLAEIVCTRAARLYACGIAALCRKQGINDEAVDTLGEILDWPEGQQLVKLVTAEDGSGVGSALIAAITLNQ